VPSFLAESRRPPVLRTSHVLAAAAWLAGAMAIGCAGEGPPPRTSPAPRPPAPVAGAPRSRPEAGTSGRSPSKPVTRPPASSSLTLSIEIGPRGTRSVAKVDLESYVRDVVVGELAVGAGDAGIARPAYEAQAIVARTYALAGRGRHAAEGFDLCSTTHCQVYVRDQWRRSRWAVDVDEAVQRTRGRHLASGGKPIEAVFHASCGGHTSAAAEVWRSRGASYLAGVADPYCVREQPEGWTSVLDLETLRAALNQRPRTEVGDRLDGVQVLRRDAGGRVVELALSGSRAPVVTAEDFRLAVMAAAGPRSLRSARFEVERVGAQLRFVGRGSGHGVGLCQIGLIGRLRAGQSPAEALLTYYPGVTIVSADGT
jgi:stage II sporulation protein D